MTIDFPEKIWRQRPWNEKDCLQLAATMNIPLEIAAILNQRGISDPDAIEAFLHPRLDHLPSPMTMKGMAIAVKMLSEAIVARHSYPILIYGDYDVDGITGVAVLYNFLRLVGIDADYYIPNRLTEGYGLNSEAIRRLHRQYKNTDIRQGVKPILITVDCGISNIDEVRVANELGFSVIVTDHHQPKDLLPEAVAILNPLQQDCQFPFKELAGVGVVFYLVMGLRNNLKQMGFWQKNDSIPNLKEYLDLVALGTIADIVSLLGVNRIFVKAGLEVLSNTSRIGLKHLMEKTGIFDNVLSIENIAFQICPRINAAGRIGNADIAFRLLVSESESEVSELIIDIENANLQRKNYANLVYESAQALAKSSIINGNCSLVLGNSDWHQGVLGIAAAKITNLYNRPTLLFRFEEHVAKGSGRAMQGLNLNEILRCCSEYLINYGGHDSAIGCTIDKKKFNLFAEKFEMELKKRTSGKTLQAVLWIDLKLQPSKLNSAFFLKHYKMLEPFGKDNEEPIFICSKASKLFRPRQVGKDSLKFIWQEENFSCSGYGFGFADFIHSLEKNKALIAYKLRNNMFRGINRWELKTEDIRIIATH